MDWLEEELKQALARKLPPAGFADRLAAASQRPRVRPRPWPGRQWLAAAAAILLVAGGAAEYREYRGRQAKARVLLALRITSGTLTRIQTRALRTPRREGREARP